MLREMTDDALAKLGKWAMIIMGGLLLLILGTVALGLTVAVFGPKESPAPAFDCRTTCAPKPVLLEETTAWGHKCTCRHHSPTSREQAMRQDGALVWHVFIEPAVEDEGKAS